MSGDIDTDVLWICDDCLIYHHCGQCDCCAEYEEDDP